MGIIKKSLMKADKNESFIKMEDINDADYTPAKRVCKYFEIKHSGDYHNLYVQSEICILKYMSLILLIFFLHQD